MKNKYIHHIHSGSLSLYLSLYLSLSICNFSFSRSLIFSLSRSLTHTIFLHLSQIFKANIILQFCSDENKRWHRRLFSCFRFRFPDFLLHSLTHEWIIQTSSIRCLHAVANQNYHHKRVVNPNQAEGVWYENKRCQRQLTENIMTRARANPIKACAYSIKRSKLARDLFPKLHHSILISFPKLYFFRKRTSRASHVSLFS